MHKSMLFLEDLTELTVLEKIIALFNGKTLSNKTSPKIGTYFPAILYCNSHCKCMYIFIVSSSI